VGSLRESLPADPGRSSSSVPRRALRQAPVSPIEVRLPFVVNYSDNWHLSQWDEHNLALVLFFVSGQRVDGQRLANFREFGISRDQPGATFDSQFGGEGVGITQAVFLL